MADQLATPEDLASFLQLGPYADLTPARQANLTMLIELATSKIQRAAAGQRIIAATTTGALIDLPLFYEDRYVPLPQRPVRSVSAVAIDGTPVTDYLLRSGMLWRGTGWWSARFTPAQLTVTYAHGLLPGAQDLQLARSYTLELARGGWGNPSGVTSKAIDDYRVTYSEADARMTIPPGVAAQLASAYGTGAYVTVSRD